MNDPAPMPQASQTRTTRAPDFVFAVTPYAVRGFLPL